MRRIAEIPKMNTNYPLRNVGSWKVGTSQRVSLWNSGSRDFSAVLERGQSVRHIAFQLPFRTDRSIPESVLRSLPLVLFPRICDESVTFFLRGCGGGACLSVHQLKKAAAEESTGSITDSPWKFFELANRNGVKCVLLRPQDAQHASSDFYAAAKNFNIRVIVEGNEERAGAATWTTVLSPSPRGVAPVLDAVIEETEEEETAEDPAAKTMTSDSEPPLKPTSANALSAPPAPEVAPLPKQYESSGSPTPRDEYPWALYGSSPKQQPRSPAKKASPNATAELVASSAPPVPLHLSLGLASSSERPPESPSEVELVARRHLESATSPTVTLDAPPTSSAGTADHALAQTSAAEVSATSVEIPASPSSSEAQPSQWQKSPDGKWIRPSAESPPKVSLAAAPAQPVAHWTRPPVIPASRVPASQHNNAAASATAAKTFVSVPYKASEQQQERSQSPNEQKAVPPPPPPPPYASPKKVSAPASPESTPAPFGAAAVPPPPPPPPYASPKKVVAPAPPAPLSPISTLSSMPAPPAPSSPTKPVALVAPASPHASSSTFQSISLYAEPMRTDLAPTSSSMAPTSPSGRTTPPGAMSSPGAVSQKASPTLVALDIGTPMIPPPSPTAATAAQGSPRLPYGTSPTPTTSAKSNVAAEPSPTRSPKSPRMVTVDTIELLPIEPLPQAMYASAQAMGAGPSSPVAQKALSPSSPTPVPLPPPTPPGASSARSASPVAVLTTSSKSPSQPSAEVTTSPPSSQLQPTPPLDVQMAPPASPRRELAPPGSPGVSSMVPDSAQTAPKSPIAVPKSPAPTQQQPEPIAPLEAPTAPVVIDGPLGTIPEDGVAIAVPKKTEEAAAEEEEEEGEEDASNTGSAVQSTRASVSFAQPIENQENIPSASSANVAAGQAGAAAGQPTKTKKKGMFRKAKSALSKAIKGDKKKTKTSA
mmetsp:Transcript_20522/g.33775  ORF Transcript_20522/g.33775 Transcript_20522/m.33775 type:complete len:937 (+) Transcript_20522:130-2940(+)